MTGVWGNEFNSHLSLPRESADTTSDTMSLIKNNKAPENQRLFVFVCGADGTRTEILIAI